jgi:2-dehydropantoate 2-reductase
MKIAILGSGGVGGYFGGRLAASGADVSFVARGAHLEALKSRGLRLESPKGDLHLPRVHATDDPSGIGHVDVVFFTVKLYDTVSALRLLPPLIGPNTVVIPFQNGVDGVDALMAAVGPGHVAGGSAYIFAVIGEPGLIRHTGVDRLVFGELDGAPSTRLQALHAACVSAGFQATISERILVDVWTKFVRLSVLSGMTTATRCPVWVIREDPELFAMFQAAGLETMAVARACGVDVPATVVSELGRMLETLPATSKSSMLEDLERGRPLELPWLSGAVVRIGRERGVDTPIHRFITAVLQPHVAGRQPRSTMPA